MMDVDLVEVCSINTANDPSPGFSGEGLFTGEMDIAYEIYLKQAPSAVL